MNDNFDIQVRSSTTPVTPGVNPTAPHILMSEWKPDKWETPSVFSAFPILDICPEAPNFFAEAGYFSIRDLRAIVSNFSLPVDHMDPHGVYRILLEVTQTAPWIFPVIEALAAENRGQ